MSNFFKIIFIDAFYHHRMTTQDCQVLLIELHICGVIQMAYESLKQQDGAFWQSLASER